MKISEIKEMTDAELETKLKESLAEFIFGEKAFAVSKTPIIV